MKKCMTALAITLVGGVLTFQSAFAADSKTSLGLGVGLVPDYEGSDYYTAIPMLYGRYSYGDGAYLQLRGNELKWNFLNDKVELGPLLEYRMSRNDVESNRVEKMDKVDSAVAAGAFITGRIKNWSAGLKFATDISGEDTGYTVTLGGDYSAKFSDKLRMTFGVSTTYASADYMETYFQVDDDNRGNTTLDNNDADNGEFKDYGLHMTANYSFTSNWSVVGNLGYKRLVGEAADSPIVDDAGSANQFFLGATAVYTF